MTVTTEGLVARLRRNPDDTAAYAALKAHYHQQSDFASLANLVEGWAKRSQEPAAAARAFHEAGRLIAHYQSDHARTVSLFERALERDPHFKDAHRDLDHLLDAIGDPQLRVESLDRRVASFTKANVDPHLLALLQFKLGEAWEHDFQRPDRAVAHYVKAMELDKAMVQAIYAARRIYQEAGNHKAAADLLEQEATAEGDRDRALSLLLELAHLRAHHLDDLPGAVRAAETALGIAPGQPHVMGDLADYLVHRAARLEPVEAARDVERAADLYFQLAESNRMQGALEYCQAALDALPSHEQALELLEFLAHDNGCPEILPPRWVRFIQSAVDSPAVHRRRVMLADAYAAAAQLEDAVFCLEPLLALGDADAAGRLADLYRQLGQPVKARAALAKAVDALPPRERIARLHTMIVELEVEGLRDEAVRQAEAVLEVDETDEEARRFLESAYRDAVDIPRLRGLYMRLGANERLHPATRAELYRRAAAVSGEDDPEATFEANCALLELEPDADEAAQAIRAHLEAKRRWDELASDLERRALTLTDPIEKAAQLFELAVLHQDKRLDSGEALRVLRSLHALAPRHRESNERFARALLDLGAYEEAVPILRERIAETESQKARYRLQHQLAEVLDEKLADAEGAYRIYQQLLDQEPGDLRAIERMERLDRHLGRHDRLMETLGLKADVVAPAERPALLVQMAMLAARALGDAERAITLLQEAISLAPADVETREQLRRLLAESNRHEDLVRLLDEILTTESNRARRIVLLRDLARTLGGPLADAEGAASAYERLLAEADDDEEAVAALLEHAERKGDHEAWVELAARRIVHLVDPVAIFTLKVARADVLVNELGHLREGAKVLNDALEDAFDPAPVLEQLAEIYEELGDHRRLAETLERHLNVAHDLSAKVVLAERLVTLHEGPMADLEGAVHHAYGWASLAPHDATPLERLVSLLERTDRHTALLEALDALSVLVPACAHENARRAAWICVESLSDPDAALGRLEARLTEGDESVWPMIREIALGHGRAHALADLLVRRAERAREADEARALFESAAEVLRDHAEDPPAALTAMLRAFALAPRDPTLLERLETSAALANDFDRLVLAYGRLVGLDLSEDERVGYLVRLAEVLDRLACDPERALEPIMAACTRNPERDDLFTRASELAERAGRLDRLTKVYERRADTTKGERRFTALLKSAELASEITNNPDRAIEHVLHAAEMAEHDPRALARVEALAARLDERQPGTPFCIQLVALYQSLAGKPGAARSCLLLRAASILSDSLGQPRQAYALLRQVCAADPSEHALLATLHTLARRADALDDFDALLATLVEEALDTSTATRLLRRRGELLRDDLDRASEAADVFQRLVMLARDDVPARRALFHTLQHAGRYEDLAMALERVLRIATDLEPDERIALRRVLAQIWECPLRNRHEALDAWKKVLAEAGDDVEASESVSRIKNGGPLLSDVPTPFERPIPTEPLDALGDGLDHGEGRASAPVPRPVEPISEVLLLDDVGAEPLDSGEISLEPLLDAPARESTLERSHSLPPPPPPSRSVPADAPMDHAEALDADVKPPEEADPP